MKTTLGTALCALLVMGATACAEGHSQPASIDVDALIEAAPNLDPAGLTEGLDLDPRLKAHLDASLTELHGAMLELHERYEAVAGMEGEERTRVLGELKTEAQSIHERHQELWTAIPEADRQAIMERVHDQMREHHAQMGASHEDHDSMHEKAKHHLQKLHGH